MAKHRYDGTQCFTCQNAVPNPQTGRGCSWSRSFKPVKNWLAEMTIIHIAPKSQIISYRVIDCPEYIADPPYEEIPEVEERKNPSTKDGEKMREARIINGLTRVQLAKLCGVSNYRIRSFEELCKIPEKDVKEKIEEILGVSLWGDMEVQA